MACCRSSQCLTIEGSYHTCTRPGRRYLLHGGSSARYRAVPYPGIRPRGGAFVLGDRELDRAISAPLWLKDPRIADAVTQALKRGESEFRLYDLLAWAVMPNHVHVVFQPFRELPQVTRWIKGSTARTGNLLLGRTGQPFWQHESYDHCVRNSLELNRVIRYVERNPVTAGLAEAIEDRLWSSAWQA